MPAHENGTSRLTPLAPDVATAVAMISVSSFDRDAVDFVDAGHALLDLFQPGTPQVPDTFFGGLVGDVDGIAAFHDDASQRLGDWHDLVDAHAALVAVGA